MQPFISVFVDVSATAAAFVGTTVGCNVGGLLQA